MISKLRSLFCFMAVLSFTLCVSPVSRSQTNTQSGLFAAINATTRNDTASREVVVIADKKVALLPIVIATNATEQTRALAAELAQTLEKISGAAFEIKSSDTKTGDTKNNVAPAIFVGTLNEFPTPSAVQGLKIVGDFDGREAFAIRTEDKSIKLIGATEKGVPFAVTRFLETLGCRWLNPNPKWTVVPKTTRLIYNRNQTDRPELISRYFGYPRDDYFEKGDPGAGTQLRTWFRRNFVGKSFVTRTGHSASEIRRRFKSEFEAHPEYTALVEGKRTPGNFGQLCISNPELQKLVAQYAVEYFEKHPEEEMMSGGPDDGGGYCTCEVCSRLWPNPGDAAFYLANVAAKAIQKPHPGKYVGILAYNWHCDPPRFEMEPNVYVEVTSAMLLNTKYSFEELMRLWPKKVEYVGVYDYWAVYDWTRDTLPAGRTSDTSYIAQKLPAYIQNGICAMNAESGNSWGGQGLGYYLASRVLWNSSVDVQALKNDYIEKGFGSAAREMQTYYARVDKASGPLAGPTFYRLAIDDLDRAEKAAQGNAEVLERIKNLKQYHVYLYFWNREAANVSNEERKQFAFEMLKWNYRIRNTEMTFWDFFILQTARRFAIEYKEPSWNYFQMRTASKLDEIPYRVDKTEPTLEETNKILAEAKKYYGEPVSMEETTWSNDYVVPKFSQKAPPIGDQLILLAGNQTMLVEGKANQPLRLQIFHATVYENKAPGTYTLSDKDGKVIATGRVPNGEHTIEIKVPRDEVYYLRYEDNEAGWGFRPTPGVRSAFLLQRKNFGQLNVRRGDFSFYVPKGTKEIRLYSSMTHQLRFYTPDFKTVGNIPGKQEGERAVSTDGRVVTIPVPDGADGKLWFSSDIGGYLYFFNIPNVILTSRDGPIVPRELAEKDELELPAG